MITCMSDILCVTNRKLCGDDFLIRIGRIAQARPAGIILREKDLDSAEYEELGAEVIRICGEYDVPCILHSFPHVAEALGATALHLPMPVLRQLPSDRRSGFEILGASCHSVEEALEAERLGASYITAGHIFETDCKKGLAGRGLEFLKEVCDAVGIPVYGIGGISPDNVVEIRKAGSSGGCIMSGLMKCKDPEAYLKRFE